MSFLLNLADTSGGIQVPLPVSAGQRGGGMEDDSLFYPQAPCGRVGAVFRLMFGWCSMGYAFVHTPMVRSRKGADCFLKPPHCFFLFLFFPICLLAVPGWRLLQCPFFSKYTDSNRKIQRSHCSDIQVPRSLASLPSSSYLCWSLPILVCYGTCRVF